MKHFKNWLIMGTKYERYHISFKAFKQLFDSKTKKNPQELCFNSVKIWFQSEPIKN